MAKVRGFRNATQDARGLWWADETDEEGNVTGRVLVEPTGGGEDNEGNPILPYRAVVSGGRGDDTQALDSRIQEKIMLGYDPSIAEQFAVNMPAGFAGDAKNLAVGEQLTPAQVSSVISQLNQPGAYEGVSGMTPDQYFADPRAAIQADNGAYTFRPDLMQGDFKSVDQESLMQQLGALPFVLGGFAAPYLASLGVVGAGAGALGASGEMSFLGDVANVAGAGAGSGLAATPAAIDSFLNTIPSQFGAELAPSLLNTGALTQTPVSALSGLGSTLPAGGLEALMSGSALTMANPLTGLPMTLDAANTIPSVGEFTQTLDMPAQTNAFEAPVDAPTTPTQAPTQQPSILDQIKQVTDNPLYKTASALGTVSSVIQDDTPTLESLVNGAQSGVNFTDLVNGGVPSITDSINAATNGSGITMPTLNQTGSSLGLPSGGLQSILQNTPYNTTNPVSGLPTTLYPDGSSSVQQTGGAAPNLTTNTPSGSVTTPNATGQNLTSAQTLSKLLKDQFGLDLDPNVLNLLGSGASSLLGMYSADKQAQATNDLYNRYFDLGAPYRQSLAALEANPTSYYSSPMVQGALQQGSDAMARSLSAKVGNPILNPTAMQEMQNYTTRGLLDAYNNRFSQLASAGQLGVSQSAPLGLQAANAQGGTANALGAGIRSVFGNQPDYAQQMLDIIKNRGLGSNSYSLP